MIAYLYNNTIQLIRNTAIPKALTILTIGFPTQIPDERGAAKRRPSA